MDDEPVQLPIDGTLDLHTFQPKDVRSVVQEYLAVCRERGIFEVRIIHGKGIGALRETVHATLRKIPEVESFHLATDSSEWGATIAYLKPAR